MPTTPGCQVRRREHDAAARRRRRPPRPARWPRRASRARSPGGRGSPRRARPQAARRAPASSVVSSSTERVASARRPPAFRRGARRKPTAPVDTAPTPLTALSAAMPGRSLRRELAQAVLHQHAVLLDHRHHVGDRAERDQVEVAAQVGHVGPPRLAQPHAHAQRQVEGDAGAAQPGERKAGVGLDRVEHRRRPAAACPTPDGGRRRSRPCRSCARQARSRGG